VPRYLHLLTADPAPLAGAIIARQGAEPDAHVTVVLLADAPAPALPGGVAVARLGEAGLDHAALLALIFASDSVTVW
jgi:hypothetical protein